jgi:hypothetical protein
MKSEFETWPATPVEASLEINEVIFCYGTSRSASFSTNGAAGVGRPFEKREVSEVSMILTGLTSDIGPLTSELL